MIDELGRRMFLAAGAAGLLVPGGGIARATESESSTAPDEITLPRTEPVQAKEMVGVCHFNEERVRELLKEDRSLALATWDWGFGDWETALGAASHTGRRSIAEALIEHGARPDLFTFAMLDKVEAVRAVCESAPGIQRTPGPHGLTLLHHARSGKADRVIDYLTKLGGADQGPEALELPADQYGVYMGEYAFEGGGGDRLIIRKDERWGLVLERTGEAFRSLNRIGDHVFSPMGAPHVSVRFRVTDGRAVGLTIHRGRPVLSAKRVEG